MADWDNDYYTSYDNTFKWIMAMFVVMMILLGIVIYLDYVESSNACEKFGGKLSGQMNCIKNGVSYDLETKGIFTMKKQVVRKAVDINDASSEDKE